MLWMPKGLEAVYGKKQQWATGGAFIMIDEVSNQTVAGGLFV